MPYNYFTLQYVIINKVISSSKFKVCHLKTKNSQNQTIAFQATLYVFNDFPAEIEADVVILNFSANFKPWNENIYIRIIKHN